MSRLNACINGFLRSLPFTAIASLFICITITANKLYPKFILPTGALTMMLGLLIIVYAVFHSLQAALFRVEQQVRNLKSREDIQNESLNNLESLVQDRTVELVKVNSDLILAKESAESAAATRSIFLSQMSASFRTPLMGILLYNDLINESLQEGNLDKDQIYQDLDKIKNSANQLLRDIDHVLDFAQMEGSTSIQPNLSTVITSDFLKNVGGMTTSLHSSNQNQFSLDISPTLPTTFRTDLPKLTHVCNSILDNAFKFTLRGMVTLRVSSDTDFLTLVVSDTGCGIPSDKLISIDTGFSNSLHQGKESLGISLALSKRYLNVLGGFLLIKTQVNLGTIVTIKVPINPVLSETSPTTALIFRENSNIELAKVLTKMGYWTAVADTLDEFMSKALALKPHLAILSLGPDLDGPAGDTAIKFKLTPSLEGCRLLLIQENFNHLARIDIPDIIGMSIRKDKLARLLSRRMPAYGKPVALLVESPSTPLKNIARSIESLGWSTFVTDSISHAIKSCEYISKPDLIITSILTDSDALHRFYQISDLVLINSSETYKLSKVVCNTKKIESLETLLQ